MKALMMVLCIVSTCAAYDVAPLDTLHPDTCCSMVVTTDNGDIVKVWLDRNEIGKTPLCIKGLTRGRYDVSFMDPNKRDAILNSNENTQNPDFQIINPAGQLLLSRASGEMAREANKHPYYEPGKTSFVVFHIGQAAAETKRLNRKGQAYIIACVIGIPVAIGLMILGLSMHPH